MGIHVLYRNMLIMRDFAAPLAPNCKLIIVLLFVTIKKKKKTRNSRSEVVSHSKERKSCPDANLAVFQKGDVFGWSFASLVPILEAGDAEYASIGRR